MFFKPERFFFLSFSHRDMATQRKTFTSIDDN
jgi:hypothetical protein